MFECKMCCYSSERSTDLDRHKKTKKHIANEQKFTTNDTDRKSVCESCGESFLFFQDLLKHQKNTCPVVDKLDNTYKKLRQKIKRRDLQIKDLETRVDILLGLVGKSSDVAMQNSKNVEKSMRGMTKALKYLRDAPRMKLLEGKQAIKLLTYDNKKTPNDAVEIFITRHKNKGLKEYLANIIINEYKKDDPQSQSLWGVDTTRFHFIVKQKEWTSDKGGTKLTELIINPFLAHVEKMIREYMKDKTTNCDPLILDDFSKKIILCMEILADITKRKMHKHILHHIISHFELTSEIIDTLKNNSHNDVSSDISIMSYSENDSISPDSDFTTL